MGLYAITGLGKFILYMYFHFTVIFPCDMMTMVENNAFLVFLGGWW